LGDVKLAAVAGVWIDWPLIPVTVEIAALSALLAYGVSRLMLRLPVQRSARLPFGLFFAPAIWLGWLLQEAFLVF
jgi:leader peptidase (prepilin peptidase)/N-methyltransferase